VDPRAVGAAVTAPTDRIQATMHAAIEADRAIDALRAAASAGRDA
jgi:hypothetical protein